jgi:CRISPR/Cas system-associated endoribonuclease Cas2
MKRQLLILICFISFIQIAVAQKYVHEFGKYSNEEFQLQRYDKDPSAEAVVIYDIGKSRFIRNDDGFHVIFERRMKIKIFTKAGLKWAQNSIAYYEENRKLEQITELKGNTYNFENGQLKISALDPKNAYNEKYNEHWYNKKFAMPDVKEGSVIEISYTIDSPYLFNFRNWEFQNKIPVMYSEYTTIMIPFYEYTYIFQGATKFDDFKSNEVVSTSSPFNRIEYKDMSYCFVMKDLPAFKDESFITSADDYIVKLDFQLAAIHQTDGSNQPIMTTWPKLSQDMIDHDLFGRFSNSSKKKCKEIVDTMQLATKPALEKAKSIEHFIKSNYNWNGHSDKFTTKSVKEFLTSKTGNCADINLFLTGMLNAAGIEAYPVIISTRSNGKIKLNYPFLHFFNYVVVLAKIDSSSVLLDATEPLSNFNEIPSRCINDVGLVIQKNKVEWVNIKSSSTSNISYYFDLQLNADKDSIIQLCKLVTTGYEAIDYRNKFSNSYKDLKVNILGNNSLSGDTINPIDLNQIEKPFEIDFVKKNPTEIVEDKIIISPFCNFTITENPLKQTVRNYPVDLIYRKSYKFQSTIAIPEGYKLLSFPAEVAINNSIVRIAFVADTQKKGTILLVGSYLFKKDVYGIADYSELKGYFNRIVEKFNEKLVFVKDTGKS